MSRSGKKKRIRWGMMISAVVLAGVAYSAIKAMNILRTIGGGDIVKGWYGVTNPRSEFPGKSHITLLLIGKDYNRDKKGMEFTKNSRADTIMLMGVDLDKGSLSAVSIPRDTRVQAADGKVGKINGTMTRGGATLVTQTISQMFDVPVDYTVVLKADAVRSIVDAVGGITIETIDAMNYDDSWGQLHIHLPKGRQRVDGEGAVGFVRFREVNRTRMNESGQIVPIRGVKGSLEEGDQRRTERQQQLVRALIAEAMTPKNLNRADSIIDTGFKQIETNMKPAQVAALGMLFRSAGLKSMKTATLDGADAKVDGLYYFVPNMERSQALVDWMIKGDDNAMNKAIRVTVMNGSGINGAARKLVEKLVEKGYTASSGGNAKQSTVTTVFFTKAAYLERAQKLRDVVGAAEVRKLMPGQVPLELVNSCEILVIIGSDKNVSGSAQANLEPRH